MRSKAIKTFLTIATVASTIMVACSDDDNPTPPEPKPGVQIANNATLGKIMTDSAGRTLYFFSDDTKDSSTCYGGCLAAWPVFYVANPTFGDTSLHAADFGVTTRRDGSKQTTYKGYPLYYFAQDAAPGDVNGEGVGGIWFVAKTDYTVMLNSAQLVGHDGLNYNSQFVQGDEITKYLTDALGRTLYGFKPDKFNVNTYTKPDFSNNAIWPIYEVAEIKSIPSTLQKNDFDTIHVFNRVQLTYKGRPLYYFGQDNNQRGSTKGVSFPNPGQGIWPTVNGNTTPAPNP